MTRTEHGVICDALFDLHEGYNLRAIRLLEGLSMKAQKEFDAEDRHHDAAETDSIPVNAEAA